MTPAQHDQAVGTMSRSDKGAVTPAPALDGPLQIVARAVANWPRILTTSHWHFYDRSRVDGVDFYFDDRELGHINLDGSLHIATSPALGKALISERLARPFPYQRGWVCEGVYDIGTQAAIGLFRRNYDRLHWAAA